MTDLATYSPADNKIRLYVGRVPRDEYLALRSDGWKSTPKQDCDFVATWSPSREDTALDYADSIDDEDYSPTDRAADRAERFAMYRDKRRDEAGAHADNYSAVHGYQSQNKADRAARKADRVKRNALGQWSKAEYWQQRTAGVISSALYKESPSVRRGRILRLETEQRRYTSEGSRWNTHLAMRLIYERAMLENEGGTAAIVDIVPGGFFGCYQVVRVHKSPATKLVVSVSVWADSPYYRGEPVERADGTMGNPLTLQKLNIQRYSESAYRAPTDEELEAFNNEELARKKRVKAKNAGNPKLINPTLEDAQRLQDHWNAKYKAEYDSTTSATRHEEYKPSEVVEVSQKRYSASSRNGYYSSCETAEICEHGHLPARQYGRVIDKSPVIFKIRSARGIQEYKYSHHRSAPRVIVITDKPQKSLPAWTIKEVVA